MNVSGSRPERSGTPSFICRSVSSTGVLTSAIGLFLSRCGWSADLVAQPLASSFAFSRSNSSSVSTSCSWSSPSCLSSLHPLGRQPACRGRRGGRAGLSRRRLLSGRSASCRAASFESWCFLAATPTPRLRRRVVCAGVCLVPSGPPCLDCPSPASRRRFRNRCLRCHARMRAARPGSGVGRRRRRQSAHVMPSGMSGAST